MALQKRLTEQAWQNFKHVILPTLCSKYYSEDDIVSFYRLDEVLDLTTGDTAKAMALFLLLDMDKELPKVLENIQISIKNEDLSLSPQVLFKFIITHPNEYKKEKDYEMVVFLIYSVYGVEFLNYLSRKRKGYLSYRNRRLHKQLV